jgi:peroxiredoxin
MQPKSIYTMNKLSLALLSALCAFSLNAAVKTGAVAPDFTLTDTGGATHSLSDFKGKYVVLEWTNHQCPFVMKHYAEGDMQAMQKAFTSEGVIWLQIVSSAPGKQGNLTAEDGEALREKDKVHSTALLLDSTGVVGKQYDARTTPHMYLINPEGSLVYQGAIDSIRSTRSSDIAKATNYLKAAFDNSIAGKPVAEDTTTPYGCSVKY